MQRSIYRHLSAVSDHFTLPAHSMDNIELVSLELITSTRDAIRKARVVFRTSKGKALETFGLNDLKQAKRNLFYLFF